MTNPVYPETADLVRTEARALERAAPSLGAVEIRAGGRPDTPYYLIDESELRTNVAKWRQALHEYWDNHILSYSVKTNSLPWLLSYFERDGLYAEVVSHDEYELGSLVGYGGDKMIYNGPVKSKDSFLAAVREGCVVNIDSQRELAWLTELELRSGVTYEVGLRVNFDLEGYCPHESGLGSSGSRFGFSYENGDLKRAIDYLDALEHVTLAGIHFHCNSKTRSLGVYQAIARVACLVQTSYALDLKYVDVGGGFFGGLDDKPQPADYLRVISAELSKGFDAARTTLIVEPGNALVASPVSFVSGVVDVKQTSASRFVVTDGSRTNVDPWMNRSRYFHRVEMAVDTERMSLAAQVISGSTCLESDRLFVLENHAELKPGDRIIYEKVGAYTMCISPLFIHYFPPVYVAEEGRLYRVREKWTADEYVQRTPGVVREVKEALS